MKVAGPFSILLGCAVACGQGQSATDPSAVVVPPQPKPTGAPVASSSPVVTPPTPIASAAIPFKCETGKRFEIGKRSYCAYEQPDNWEASETRCVANGGHLLSLDTAQTSSAVRTALWSPVGAARAAWIGLEGTKAKGKREWKWVSGEALATPSWKPNEPNDWDQNEGCAEFLTAYGAWNDTRCNLKQGYLCQAKGTAKLACTSGKAFDAGGVSYCLNAKEKTQADAKRQCGADGGTLAILKTVEENKAVRDAIAARVAAHRMWIGLSDAAEEGTWAWTSGANIGFTAWHPGEPNDYNGENCAELFTDSWTWNDRDCTLALPSVCESPRR